MDAGALGSVGLGVTGEPMCRNLAFRSGRPVPAADLRAAPLHRLADAEVRTAGPECPRSCCFRRSATVRPTASRSGTTA